jgi:hypothetical protein
LSLHELKNVGIENAGIEKVAADGPWVERGGGRCGDRYLLQRESE